MNHRWMNDAESLWVIILTFPSTNGRYSTELLDKVKEMAEGVVVEDAPVFKTRDEIMKKQQVRLWTHAHTEICWQEKSFVYSSLFHHRVDDRLSRIIPSGRVGSSLKTDGTQLLCTCIQAVLLTSLATFHMVLQSYTVYEQCRIVTPWWLFCF